MQIFDLLNSSSSPVATRWAAPFLGHKIAKTLARKTPREERSGQADVWGTLAGLKPGHYTSPGGMKPPLQRGTHD